MEQMIVYVIVRNGQVDLTCYTSLRAACKSAGFGYCHVSSRMGNGYFRKGVGIMRVLVEKIKGRGVFKK